MSEYLGWRQRRPPVSSCSSSSSRLEHDVLPGGPVSHSFESYVKNVFHPSNRGTTNSVGGAGNPVDLGVPASTMLRMERTLGKYAIDDSNDETLELKTPLESLYAELGLRSPEEGGWRQYPVYEPKQSSEYFAVMNNRSDFDKFHRDLPKSTFSTYKEKADEEWRKNNRQTLIDYSNFHSAPLSPYLYQNHPYVRTQDSRIVGSNFVQLTSRPKDRFLEKVDATLAEIRSQPRFAY